jgi:hypothetical protein
MLLLNPTSEFFYYRTYQAFGWASSNSGGYLEESYFRSLGLPGMGSYHDAAPPAISECAVGWSKL